MCVCVCVFVGMDEIYIHAYRYQRAADIHESYIAIDFLLRKHTRRWGSTAAVYREDLIIIIIILYIYIFYKHYKIASNL